MCAWQDKARQGNGEVLPGCTHRKYDTRGHVMAPTGARSGKRRGTTAGMSRCGLVGAGLDIPEARRRRNIRQDALPLRD